MELQGRVNYIRFLSATKFVFPTHKGKYIRRENKIVSETNKFVNGEVDAEKLAENISGIFIHPKYYTVIKKVTDMIDKKTQTLEDGAKMCSKIIFLDENSSQAVRSKAAAFFDNDWLKNN